MKDVRNVAELLEEIAMLRARVEELEHSEREQRRVQQALRESRARLRTLVSNAPVVLFALDGQGRFTLSEGKGLDALGLKPGQAVGESAFEMYGDHPAIVAQLRRALSGEAFNARSEVAGAVFDVRYSPLHDEAGNVDGCIGVATDITDLATSEEKFRLLAENIPGVIYLCRNDARYTMIYLNDSVEKLTGYSTQAFLDDRASFTELFHPEDAPRIAPQVDAALAAREPFHLEYRIQHRRGHWVWIEEWGVGVFREGKPELLEGYLTDITKRVNAERAIRVARDELEQRVEKRTAKLQEANDRLLTENNVRRRAERDLRESEERFRQLAENIDEVFWLMGADLKHAIYISPAFERIWGRPISEAYEPDGWINGIHPDDRNRVLRAHYEKAIRGDFDVEYRVLRPDGAIRYIHDRAFPIRNEGGLVYRVAGVAQDITDQKMTEERIRKDQEALAHVLRVSTVGEMASGLAHELNQPLAAIINYTRGCIRRVKAGVMTEADLVEKLDKIAVQADRAGDIVKTVRRYITTRDSHRTETDLNALVFDAIKLAELDIHQHGVNVDFEPTPDLPPVRVDRVQIEQVILNVVRNGVEAMEARPPESRTLSIGTSTDGNGHVEVCIRDSGQGIEGADPGRVFEPFVSSKAGGLGMGLSISRSIIESHGGHIWGESSPTGTAFRFTLPARQENE